MCRGESPTPPPKTKRCLDAIKSIAARGQLPTYGRLMKRLKRSKNAVREAVARLKRGGWIETTPFVAGGNLGIRVVEEAT